MKLITNNHADVINELVHRSNKIVLCSGWLNKSGIKKIYNSLVKASENNAEITIYSNSKHSTKPAINLIKECKNIKHIIVDNKNKYLHSKIYYFEHGKAYSAIIGSANLTEGGLGNNEELSVLVTSNRAGKEYDDIISYLHDVEKLR